MKVLFSPIGGTDPIKYDRDGSMLHICRHYRPGIVCLYLSKEMLKRHKEDNRYIGCIDKLGEYIDWKFDVKIIERPDLGNAQEYNYFYEDFRKILSEIKQKYGEGCEIIFNIASGTPAMKSALLVLSLYSEGKYRAIQVMSPEKKSNERYENRDNYDYNLFWECNEDNSEEAENRCEEAKVPNLLKLMKINIIEKHIDAYDYNAALSIVEDNNGLLTDEVGSLLKIAMLRSELNKSEIDKIQLPFKDDFFPIKSGDSYKVFEYVLWLKIKVKRHEYADVARGLTPAVVNILRLVFEDKSGIKIACLTKTNSKGIEIWDNEELRKTNVKGNSLIEVLDQQFPPKFKEGSNVSVQHIAALLLELYADDLALFDLTQEIIKIEKKVRNFAAHEIVSVSEEWIQKQVGKTLSQILDIVIKLTRFAGINAKKEDWESYDIMNDKIKELMLI